MTMTYIAGIDAGSAYTKGVLLEEKTPVAFQVTPSGADHSRAAEKIMAELLRQARADPERLKEVVATGLGSGRISLAQARVTEIVSVSRAIHVLCPSVRMVIDVGAAASRIIKLDEQGCPVDLISNEKCAAGSGRFLQVIARVLNTRLDEIGPLSLRSRAPVEFNTGCAVFAESEVITRLAEGATPEDILAGIHRAVAAKVIAMADSVKRTGDTAMIGGAARNSGLVKCLEDGLGIQLHIPEHPEGVAAFGAALTATEGR
jgi:predicted CoA-substrate-specific enzyme activase